MDVLEQAKANERGKHRRSAIGDEGQWNSRHRHQPHGHANIFKGLKREPGDDPDADQATEEVIGPLGYQEGSPKEEAKEEQDQARANKSRLLSRYGEDEVGLLLRNESTIGLWAMKETTAKYSARADGYSRLPQLVAALLWVSVWIYERLKSLNLVLTHNSSFYRNESSEHCQQ